MQRLRDDVYTNPHTHPDAKTIEFIAHNGIAHNIWRPRGTNDWVSNELLPDFAPGNSLG
jgi:hypothetical protein